MTLNTQNVASAVLLLTVVVILALSALILSTVQDAKLERGGVESLFEVQQLFTERTVTDLFDARDVHAVCVAQIIHRCLEHSLDNKQ